MLLIEELPGGRLVGPSAESQGGYVKKHIIIVVLMLTAVFSVSATMAEAQTGHRFLIDVPFDFIVAGRSLPAGKYTVGRFDPSKPNALMIKSVDNRTVRVFLAQRVVGEDQPTTTSSLVFKVREGKLFLYQVWASEAKDGSQVPLADKNDKRDQYGNNSALVTLRANNQRP